MFLFCFNLLSYPSLTDSWIYASRNSNITWFADLHENGMQVGMQIFFNHGNFCDILLIDILMCWLTHTKACTSCLCRIKTVLVRSIMQIHFPWLDETRKHNSWLNAQRCLIVAQVYIQIPHLNCSWLIVSGVAKMHVTWLACSVVTFSWFCLIIGFGQALSTLPKLRKRSKPTTLSTAASGDSEEVVRLLHIKIKFCLSLLLKLGRFLQELILNFWLHVKF